MERNTDFEFNPTIAQPGIVEYSRTRAFYYFTKRVIDIVVSIVALILLSPMMLVTAALIRLDSPGPVLFTQMRVGTVRIKRKGQLYWKRKEFKFYKFRTMINKADTTPHQDLIKALINHDQHKIQELVNSNSKLIKLTNDKRITRLGHFLRRSSVDELPQFWNVLRGEMSLIGPRPAIPYEVDMYKRWYFHRFEAKPGLTGLWQVKARNSCDFDEMVKLDIEYVEHQSFWLDIKIMVMTPLVIILHRGAA
jgi:lipopolysaccharide/colanic/teichoic acid biosynthesis glycosyltransferase